MTMTTMSIIRDGDDKLSASNIGAGMEKLLLMTADDLKYRFRKDGYKPDHWKLR